MNAAYIRLVTYALLSSAFLCPTPKVNVIPVDLTAPPSLDESVEETIDRFYRKRQHAEDITRKPGFETTTRSGSEVLRLALEHVRREGIDPTGYRPPTISLFRRGEKMMWSVSWEIKGTPHGGGFFGIGIDDETGETTLFPGR